MSGRPERVKVLMLTDRLMPAGAERYLTGLALALPADRYEVCVCITRRGEAPLADVLRAAGIRVEMLDRAGKLDVAPFVRLLRLLRREGFHVVHAHKFGSNIWGTILGRLARTPVVVAHEHTWSYEGQPLRRFLDGHLIGRYADAFVAVSTRDRDRMIGVEGVPAEKIVYIPTAYIARDGEPAGGDLRAELGLGAEQPVVGALSVFRAQKRIDLLIEAFALLLERVPEAWLVLGGYGPRAESLREQARALGVDHRIHWLGIRHDPETVLAALDVAVISSDFEGMPLVAFECMAVSTALVATDVGAMEDVFENGVSALIVPRRDPAAIAAAVESLLADPARRHAMAAAAHARLEEFTVQRTAERVAGLYEELLEHGRLVGNPAAAPAQVGA